MDPHQRSAVLVDDHEMFRAGLRNLLERHTSLVIAAEAANGIEAVAAAREHQPDLVIMDYSMPLLNGPEAAEKIRRVSTGTRIICLSMHHDTRIVKQMLEAGASAFILKDNAFEHLETAIDTVFNNQIYLSPELTTGLVNEVCSTSRAVPATSIEQLSSREREVLKLLAEGHTTNAIGELLHISAKTVETHRRNIMAKTGVHTLPGLTKFAIREGLTGLDD